MSAIPTKSTVSPRVRKCGFCTHEMPISRTTCPHCGRPSFFPNVDMANLPEERTRLEQRVQNAESVCDAAGTIDVAEHFRNACNASQAVFACHIEKLHREIATGTELFEGYYELERLRLRAEAPKDFDWQKLRPQAEIELLGSEQHILQNQQLHYACLTIAGEGLENYGECRVILADAMISHRASCFEGNTAVIYSKHGTFKDFLRSPWEDRGSLAFATFASTLDLSSTPGDFSRILVSSRATSADDKFVEVHVFGPITSHSFDQVQIDCKTHDRDQKTLASIVQARLTIAKVPTTIT